ncbi:MAG TPA: (2Fe-2S)-binding protein [Casimicrobiaceae bacterium]
MERRTFLGACAALSGAAVSSRAWSDVPPKPYARVRLVDIHGTPVRPGTLARNTNYVFQYPYASTPCFLLRLDAPIAPAPELRQRDGARYAWQGGVGPDRTVVAFSAICAHKLAYPTREVSFIRYQRDRSATSGGHVIHCCADHSVYDPAEGARVIAGPAPQPLAAVVLEHDAAKDELYAIGTQGAEQFDAFFEKYGMKLVLEYGSTAKARARVDGTAVVSELSSYCRNTIQC